MASQDAEERERALAPGERGRIAVTGATGLIGRALVPALERRGHTVARVVRDAARARPGDIVWDPARGGPDAARLEGVDAVVHLAGEPIAQRWSPSAKSRILASRGEATRRLAETLAALPTPPRVLVSASAVGIYGDRGDEPLTEESALGRGFTAEVGRAWEEGLAPARAAGIRTVSLRFGIVLAAGGGALERMLPPFRLGAGGRLGSGEQWWSWIAIDDAIAVVELALADPSLEGPVNAVAPAPATNAGFTDALARVLGRPALVPVPAFALRLAFGEMAAEVLLASQRVVPARLERAGFRWRHPELEGALRAAIG
jgi:uncharacterized protein (TIGR01777 family)